MKNSRSTTVRRSGERFKSETISSAKALPSGPGRSGSRDCGASQSVDSKRIKSARAWLQRFYQANEADVPGDDLGTTFLASGALMLASILVRGCSVRQLAEMTGLPLAFAALVADTLVEAHGSVALRELKRTMQFNQNDLEDVADALAGAMEELWICIAPPWFGRDLTLARRGALFGGGLQSWFDPETAMLHPIQRQAAG